MKANKVSLHELYEIKRKKETKINDAYNVILDSCYKKIKNIAEHGGMTLYYKIPPIVIGYPLYNLNNCIEYIDRALKKSGLYVSILPPPNNSYIYISWKIEDISYKAKSNLLLE